MAEVARELGVDPGSVLYRVRRLLDAGLLIVSRTTPRAGRPVRHYCASASGFFAPFRLTDAASLEELMREGSSDSQDLLDRSLRAAWLRLNEVGEWGIHVYVDGAGRLNREFVPQETQGFNRSFWEAVLAEESPVVWDQFVTLRLPREEAKRLQRELAGVWRRYLERQDERADAYLLRLAVAPRGD